MKREKGGKLLTDSELIRILRGDGKTAVEKAKLLGERLHSNKVKLYQIRYVTNYLRKLAYEGAREGFPQKLHLLLPKLVYMYTKHENTKPLRDALERGVNLLLEKFQKEGVAGMFRAYINLCRFLEQSINYLKKHEINGK